MTNLVAWAVGLFLGLGGMGALGLAWFLGWFRRPGPLPAMEVFGPGADSPVVDGPTIRWLGHSSFRIEWAGQTLLLDPVISPRISITPRRCARPGLDMVAGADAILLSHAHMDHFDNPTLEAVAPTAVHLPSKAEGFLGCGPRRRHRIHPFAPGQTFQIGALRVESVPAKHGGWRYPWQRGFFACGFIVSDGRTVLYFAGDTAWGGHFAEIGRRYRPDIAILPIGGYSPQWFLKTRHLNPEEAAEAAGLLGARRVIPCHYGTYRVSLEPMDEPLVRFRRAMLNRAGDWSRSADSRN